MKNARIGSVPDAVCVCAVLGQQSSSPIKNGSRTTPSSESHAPVIWSFGDQLQLRDP